MLACLSLSCSGVLGKPRPEACPGVLPSSFSVRLRPLLLLLIVQFVLVLAPIGAVLSPVSMLTAGETCIFFCVLSILRCLLTSVAPPVSGTPFLLLPDHPCWSVTVLHSVNAELSRSAFFCSALLFIRA